MAPKTSDRIINNIDGPTDEVGPCDAKRCYTMKVPAIEQTLGRIINIIDAPIDKLGPLRRQGVLRHQGGSKRADFRPHHQHHRCAD